VELLLKGAMNLYYFERKEIENMSSEYYNSNLISQYFLFEKEDGTAWVIDKHPDRIVNGTQIHSDTRYKGKIRYAFNSIKPITDSYETIEFTQKSMINTAKLYNDAVCRTDEKYVIFSMKK